MLADGGFVGSVADPVDDNVRAIDEGISGNGCHAGRDVHVDKIPAVGEGSAAGGGHGVGKAEREKVAVDIRQRGIRRREFERFITELEKLPEAVSEFDDALWGSLVEYVTVGKDKTMAFTLIGGTEMRG